MATADRPDNLMKTLQGRLRFLYETEHPTAHRFRYALLVFDIATILFIVASSFLSARRCWRPSMSSLGWSFSPTSPRACSSAARASAICSSPPHGPTW